jgi:hypothetical protein
MGYDLQQRLDAFVSGEASPGPFMQELCDLCDATPDSAWDVLSLIDQYYRRGRLSEAQFRAIRYRIERHVLGVQEPETIRKLPDAPVAPEAAAGAGRAAMQERAATRAELASDAQALKIELLSARGQVQRYRKRLTTLAEFGRRTRCALADTQRELGVSRRQAMDHWERLKSNEWARAVREQIIGELTATSASRHHMRIWRPGRSSQAVVLASVLLSVGASSALRELPRHREAVSTASPTDAAALIPQNSQPGEISLSADKYVVFPGHASADIEIHRTGGASGEVSFVWWTQASGARPGRDYVSRTPKMANVPHGVETLHLSVPILANPSRKHTELFYVVISKPGGGASLGGIRRAAVIIMRPG